MRTKHGKTFYIAHLTRCAVWFQWFAARVYNRYITTLCLDMLCSTIPHFGNVDTAQVCKLCLLVVSPADVARC